MSPIKFQLKQCCTVVSNDVKHQIYEEHNSWWCNINRFVNKEKARTFGKAFNIQEEDLSFSNDWLYKFKKCNNIHKYCIHRKSESALLASLSKERARLQEVLGTDKLKLWVIGNLKRPRFLSKVNLERLPVYYQGNPKAWMNSSVFEEVFHEMDRCFRIQDKKILLSYRFLTCSKVVKKCKSLELKAKLGKFYSRI
ncbi:unnamed protein product [Rhizophagus irregularis]|nr:unnamed protein product [Rhizophagus irregularis]